MSKSLLLPVKTLSLNKMLRMHWRPRNTMAQQQKWATKVGWANEIGAYIPSLPCTITFTRLSYSNGLDTDNLAGAMKHVRDQVAEIIGVDDADPRVTWLYENEKGPERGYYAVRIEIKEVDDDVGG